jgi:cysteine desulfurase/selenocysteine lyase
MSDTIDRRRSIGDRAAPDGAYPLSSWNVSAIRRDFPILAQRIHGRPLIWLDNAATTQKPRAVIERLVRFYEQENANVHRSGHALGTRATDAYEQARATAARFINAPGVDSVVFVRGTTEATNLVAQSWGRQQVGEGDEIVVSCLEHTSNLVPWQRLAHEKRAILKIAPVDGRGQIELDHFRRLLGPRTRIVALAHVSNAIGTILPLAEMIALAHRHGARVFVDGAQAAAHLPIDVRHLDADFYAFSGHKVFGPTGIGILYIRPELAASAPPWQWGGSMVNHVTFEQTTPRDGSARFEAGTGNIAGAVGLAAALEYLVAAGPEARQHEADLTRHAAAALKRISGVRLIGDPAERIGVFSFVIDGLSAEAAGRVLDQQGLAVRAGNHCAQPALNRFGHDDSIRMSLAFYNTRDEVDALADAVQRIAGNGARIQ